MTLRATTTATMSEPEDQQGPRQSHSAMIRPTWTSPIGISSEEEFKENEDDSTYDKGSYAVSADLGVEVGPARLDVSFAQGLEE